jgi:hypothetical protein
MFENWNFYQWYNKVGVVTYRFAIANEKIIYFITESGVCTKNSTAGGRSYLSSFWKPCDIEQMLNRLTIEGKDRLFKLIRDLKITIPTKIEVPSNIRESIINKLKQFRAFNPDSAYKFNGNEFEDNILYSLTKDKVINNIGDKFYIIV